MSNFKILVPGLFKCSCGVVYDGPFARQDVLSCAKRHADGLSDTACVDFFPRSNPALVVPLIVRNKAIVELFYATGIRVTELVSLNVSQIDFESLQIRVMGKGRKERIVLFGVPASEAVRAYLEVRDKFSPDVKEKALFLNTHGTRLSTDGVRDMFNADSSVNKGDGYTRPDKYGTWRKGSNPAEKRMIDYNRAFHRLEQDEKRASLKEFTDSNPRLSAEQAFAFAWQLHSYQSAKAAMYKCAREIASGILKNHFKEIDVELESYLKKIEEDDSPDDDFLIDPED